MIPHKVEHARLYQVVILTPAVYSDSRGYFKETFDNATYPTDVEHEKAPAYQSPPWKQDAVSRTLRKGTVRGLHGDREMHKLVQCLHGAVFDVVVDCREWSPSYREWESFHLTDENHQQLFIPAGCAHGFLALTDDVLCHYKKSNEYDPAREFSVFWADPELRIPWPEVGDGFIVSPKDAKAPNLHEVAPPL